LEVLDIIFWKFTFGIFFWNLNTWKFGKMADNSTYSPASPAPTSVATTIELYEDNYEGENLFNEVESLLDYDITGDQGWMDIPLNLSMDTQDNEGEKSATLASFATEVGKSSPGKTMEKLTAAYMGKNPEMVLGSDYNNLALDSASTSRESSVQPAQRKYLRGGRGGSQGGGRGDGRSHNGYVSSTPFSWDRVKDKTVTQQLDFGWAVSTHTYFNNKYVTIRRYCNSKEPFGKYGAIVPVGVLEDVWNYYQTPNKEFDPAYPRSTTVSRNTANRKRSHNQV
jgi:hypothetical protein